MFESRKTLVNYCNQRSRCIENKLIAFVSQTLLVKKEITYLIKFQCFSSPALDRCVFFTCVTKLGKF